VLVVLSFLFSINVLTAGCGLVNMVRGKACPIP
jgi:hypothetical protein